MMSFQQCEGRKAQALHKAPEPEEVVVSDASQDGQRGQQEGQQEKRGAGHNRLPVVKPLAMNFTA